MLGCQDFCGYYDWTFDYVQKRLGPCALTALLADEGSVNEYFRAAREEGLEGLRKVWTAAGKQEGCDWTFTLDEKRNVLRWDMRKCPSKGFLLENDLNASEDYCDHCMGWIVPVLKKAGMEVTAHEHNHFGQCWAEIRVAGKPYHSLTVPVDIRQDDRWRGGYIDQWRHNERQPIEVGDDRYSDASDLLLEWFRDCNYIEVIGAAQEKQRSKHCEKPDDKSVVTDQVYVSRDFVDIDVVGVLIDGESDLLKQLAKRFLGTPHAHRPLLMTTYLPKSAPRDFMNHGLPRPIPILPLLIRTGIYNHKPGGPYPTNVEFLRMLVEAVTNASG